MKILSLNINNFGGLTPKPLPNDYKNSFEKVDWKAWNNAVNKWRNEIDSDKNISKLMDYVKNNNIDIIVFHEFDINSVAGENFTKELKKLSYKIVYPNTYCEDDFKKGNKSITVMFIRVDYEILPYNFSEKMRNVEVKVGDRIFIGVHIPLGDKNFWDSMIERYKSKKEEDKLLIIGDMNVYDLGTTQKEKFIKLLSHGAVDAWGEKNNSMDRPTANTGRRIDYAIMTPSLYCELIDIVIDDTIRNNCVTDHSAIMVEVKKFN
ncbi:hypothetical protein NSQ59_15955 [Margalitia sp. FSL K6-0131]|uniref:hypothetical protein n=1 Tax=Margalitia sp. FSL K6-0131 TaxID=2954604 RepID=UPI0030F7A6E6